MRRYIIVFGILLILSIINLALMALVLVQEKRQGWVDVVNIPGDAKTVLGKRGDVLEQLWGKWSFEGLWGSCQAHVRRRATPSGSVPSGSEPLGPDHGSTSVVEEPTPGSEPSGLSPLGSAPSSSEPSGSTQSGPDHGSTNVIEGPALNSASSTANTDHPLMEPSSSLSSTSSGYNVFESLNPGRGQES